ncbi:MAG: hypothetical protein LUE12_02305 [Ruminococcus sp.]|nr:hypothetical protein [Ruminococcus sp.]
MYISDINERKLLAAKVCRTYLIISAFCALFGAIYEYFSHEVYSYYMIYAFGFPLVLGALPFGFLAASKSCKVPTTATRYIYHSSIATLTVGSVFKGILDIYGTTSSLTAIYFYVGAAVLVIALILIVIGVMINKTPAQNSKKTEQSNAANW